MFIEILTYDDKYVLINTQHIVEVRFIPETRMSLIYLDGGFSYRTDMTQETITKLLIP